jgi:NAD(P)H-flavin reductase/ferredoxin
MGHSVRIASSDVAFECADGQSLLDAALRVGIALPYSCRKGICGTCAGRVAAGEIKGIGTAPVMNETCGPDQVLYCVCTAVTDLILEPVTWKRSSSLAPQRFTAKVYRNELAAPDVSILRLRLSAGKRARFRAGQYLQLTLDDGSARCYSMANAPHESDAVTLHIRHVPGGRFSAVLPELAAGDRVQIELPFGNTPLEDGNPRPIVFVAGGTGFAPVKSILDDMAKRRVNREITLIWGARTSNGLYMPSAIDRWRAQWTDFRFIAAISDEPATSSGMFAGRVDEALLALCSDLDGRELYCCGSPNMVTAVRVAAARCGLSRSAFHADVFVPGPASSTADLAAS